MSQPRLRSKLVDDEAICVDDEIRAVDADPEIPTRRETSSPPPPQAPSRSDRQEPSSSTGRVTCDDTPWFSDGVLAEIERRHREEVRVGNGSTEKKKANTAPPAAGDVEPGVQGDQRIAAELHSSLEQRQPLPVVGGITRNRRSRSRARRPNAEARRCPSPSHDSSPSFWSNGKNPPTDAPAYKCVDCRVWYSHAPHYHNHLTSKIHGFTVRRGSQFHWCGICRRAFPQLNDIDIHLQSKNHWKAIGEACAPQIRANVSREVIHRLCLRDGIPLKFSH